MTEAQAYETLKKYQYKHKSEQEQGAADIVQAFTRIALSEATGEVYMVEAMKGIVIMPQVIIKLIRFLKTYRGHYLKPHESL